MTETASLDRLKNELPFPGSEDVESQARSTLRFIINGNPGELAKEDPSRCPNCDAPCASTRSPYCSERCREMAGFVRQFRTGLTEGWIFDPAKQIALGQVLWHVLGGGRPLRLAISPAKAREKALKREDGHCQVCGAPATTVDHVGSGCNRPSNLRAVCNDCCEDRHFGDPQITETSEFQQTIAHLASRILSPTSLRVCDDSSTWDWRAFLKVRTLLLNSIER